MVKKLTRHGNSWALVLDKPILDLLNIDPEQTELSIVTNGKGLNVLPVRNEIGRAEFKRAVSSVKRRYGRALQKLAE
ncbi:MAG: AbrB/MazE/SpoVT family DNA-binding domain-containing protein [Tepidisphaeraceae bacterium]